MAAADTTGDFSTVLGASQQQPGGASASSSSGSASDATLTSALASTLEAIAVGAYEATANLAGSLGAAAAGGRIESGKGGGAAEHEGSAGASVVESAKPGGIVGGQFRAWNYSPSEKPFLFFLHVLNLALLTIIPLVVLKKEKFKVVDALFKRLEELGLDIVIMLLENLLTIFYLLFVYWMHFR